MGPCFLLSILCSLVFAGRTLNITENPSRHCFKTFLYLLEYSAQVGVIFDILVNHLDCLLNDFSEFSGLRISIYSYLPLTG